MSSSNTEKITLLLKKGLGASQIAKILHISLDIVEKYEHDYIKEIVKVGKGQRLRLRHKLLEDIPLLLDQIRKIADESIADPKFQMQAYKSYLTYAIPFLKEDKLAVDIEQEMKEETSQNLFDFCLPDDKKTDEINDIMSYLIK